MATNPNDFGDQLPDVIPDHRLVRDEVTGNYYRLTPEEFELWNEPEAPAIPEPEVAKPEEDTTWGDWGSVIMRGGAGMAEGIGWAIKKGGFKSLGAEEVGGFIENLGSDAVDYWTDNLSDAAKAETAKQFIVKNEDGSYEWGDAGLKSALFMGAESALPTLSGMGLGGGITKVLQAFANPVGRAALGKAVQAGLGAAEGTPAAIRAAQAAKKLKLVDSVIGAAGFGVGEGAISAVSDGVQIEKAILAMDPDKLAANPRYQQIYASTDDRMTELEKHQYAAQTLASEAATTGALQSGLLVSLLGAPMGAYFGRLLSKPLAKATSRASAAVVGGLGEAGQEGAQSVAEQVIANRQRMQAGDTDVTLGQGAVEAGVGGAIAGGLLGGTFGAVEGADQPAAAAAKKPATTQARATAAQNVRNMAVAAGADPAAADAIVADIAAGKVEIAVGIGRIRELPKKKPKAQAKPGVTEPVSEQPVYDSEGKPPPGEPPPPGGAVETEIAVEDAAEPATAKEAGEFVGGMGKGIGQSLRDNLWKAYSSGKNFIVTGMLEPALAAARKAKVSTKDRAAFDAFLTEHAKGERKPESDALAESLQPAYKTVEEAFQSLSDDRSHGDEATMEAAVELKDKFDPHDVAGYTKAVETRANEIRAELDQPGPGEEHQQIVKDYLAKPGERDFQRDVTEENRARLLAGESDVLPKGEAIDAAAHEAATSPKNDLPEPSEAQQIAGNYKKGHVKLQGLDISIEHPVGSVRTGTREDGTEWKRMMPLHYGYIRGTKGKDKDHIDVTLGDQPDDASRPVIVIDQGTPTAKKFDEHKVMLGFESKKAAIAGYKSMYGTDVRKAMGDNMVAATEMSSAEFKQWLAEGNHQRPASMEMARIRQEAAAKIDVPAALAERMDELDANTSSADVIGGKIRGKPVNLGGRLFVAMGGISRGQERSHDVYELTPADQFQGRTFSYAEKTDLGPDGKPVKGGIEDYMAKGEYARNDPLGFYHGMTVSHRGKDYVLTGPQHRVGNVDLQKVQDELEGPDEEGEAERPAGKRRTAAESEGEMSALEQDLSEGARAKVDELFKDETRSKDTRHVREAMEVYARLKAGEAEEEDADPEAAAAKVLKAAEAHFTNPSEDTAAALDEATWEGLQTITGEENPDQAELLENEVYATASDAGQLIFDTVDPKTASFDVEEFNTAQGTVEFRRKVASTFPKPKAPVDAIKAGKAAGDKSPEAANTQLEQQKAYAKQIGEKESHGDEVIVSLFDHTGVWSQPYRDAGYTIMQADIKSGQDLMNFGSWMEEIEEHISEGRKIVGVLAAPPCTSFAVSGARWWEKEHDAVSEDMVAKKYGAWAAEHFDKPLDYANTLVAVVKLFVAQADPDFYVMENPVGRIASQNNLPQATLKFNPNNFGDPYTKQTYLWGEFNADLPLNNVEASEGSKIHKLRGDDPKQKAMRSATPEGFSYAFFVANNTAKLQFKPEAPAQAATGDEIEAWVKETTTFIVKDVRRSWEKEAFPVTEFKSPTGASILSYVEGVSKKMAENKFGGKGKPWFDQMYDVRQRVLEKLGFKGDELTKAQEAAAAKESTEAGGTRQDFMDQAFDPRAVACPTCNAKIGARCKRPSGHEAMDYHAARKKLADVEFIKIYGPNAVIDYDEEQNRWGVRNKDEGRFIAHATMGGRNADVNLDEIPEDMDVEAIDAENVKAAETEAVETAAADAEAEAEAATPVVADEHALDLDELKKRSKALFNIASDVRRMLGKAPDPFKKRKVKDAFEQWMKKQPNLKGKSFAARLNSLYRRIQMHYDAILAAKKARHAWQFKPDANWKDSPQQRAADLLERIKAKNVAQLAGVLDNLAELALEATVEPDEELNKAAAEPNNLHIVEASYPSGMTRPADFEAGMKAGSPIGLSLRELSKPMQEKLVAAVNAGTQIFLDSGAFSGDIDAAAVIARYKEIAEKVEDANTGNLTLVGPDKLGDPVATLAMIEASAADIADLLMQGVKVIIPVQSNAEISPTEFGKRVIAALTAANEAVPSWYWGIPTNAVAMSDKQFREFLAADKPSHIHLLGAATREKALARLTAIDEVLPDQEVFITLDANVLRGTKGKVTEKGLGQEKRIARLSEMLAESAERRQGVVAAEYDQPAVVVKAQVKREAERETYRSILGLPEIVESANSEDFRKTAEAATAKWIADETAKADPKRAAALKAMDLGDKFYTNLQREAKVAAKAAELERNRDPAVYDATMRETLSALGIDAAAEPEQAAAARSGFDHALAGKTRSTITGDLTNIRDAAYMHGRAWIRTEEGAAWYTGAKKRSKLEGTGAALRRRMDEARARIKKIAATELEAAWNEVSPETGRSDLFDPELGEGATPGLKTMVAEIRNSIKPFSIFVKDRVLVSPGYRGDSDTIEATIKRRAEQAREGDVQKLLDAADKYAAAVGGLSNVLTGVKTIAEAATALQTAYRHDGLHVGAAPAVVNIDEVKARRADLDTFMRRRISDFFPTSWYVERTSRYETDDVRQPKKKDPLLPPKLDRVERIGVKDHRKGKDISPLQFKNTFGFADVTFGNWVQSTNRQDQDHLNYSYDSFMDLAELLGMKPKSIGFGGKLYFTIGALGSGKHAAHFQPAQDHPKGGTVPVINVTNTKGDGTIAHEWTHALDFFLRANLRSEEQHPAVAKLVAFLSAAERDYDAFWEDKIRNFAVGGHRWSGGGVRGWSPEDHAKHALTSHYYNRPSKSQYLIEAERLDKGGSKVYWGNKEELLARASEAWVFDQLDQQREKDAKTGKRSTYLVNPWVRDGFAKPPIYRGTPYPEGKEREFFAAVIGQFYKAIQWDEKGPVLAGDALDKYDPQTLYDAAKERARVRFDEIIAIAKAEKEAAERGRQIEAEAKRRSEEEERRAAEAPPPPPQEPMGPLDEAQLSDLFDEAAAQVREAAQETPKDLGPGTQTAYRPRQAGTRNAQTDQTAGQLIAEAAKAGVKGADEALAGLAALFGGGKVNSFPAYDEKTYAQAKPHFKAALEQFQKAGKSLKELFAMLIRQFGEGIKPYLIKFAQEEGLGAQLTAAPNASVQIADWVTRQLVNNQTISWSDLFDQADIAYGGSQAQGKYSVKDAYDAMEAGVNVFVMRGNAPRGSAANAKAEIERLKGILDTLPTQTKRTQETDEFQQFSTPPTYAYAVNWVANIKPGDTVLEPSAGIGGLAVFAEMSGADLILNELSKRRLEVLRKVFPEARTFSEDAAQIDNILPADIVPSVVVMNPPFSATAGRVEGKRDTMEGARHIEQALARLAPGGRLVAIVGQGMAADRPAFKAWWQEIKAKYTVRANVGVDGSGYVKYGTTFDNQILVIDKVGAHTGTEVVGNFGDISDVPAALEAVRGQRKPANQPGQLGESDAVRSGLPEALGEGQRGPAVAGLPEPAVAGAGESAAGRQRGTGSDAGQAQPAGPDAGAGLAAEPQRKQPDAGPGAAGKGGSAIGRGRDAGPVALADGGAQVSEGELARATGELSEDVFEDYQPARVRVEGGKPHKGPLVESAAMAAIPPPKPGYNPNLPKELIESGALSLPQLEAIVYAGLAHSQMLPNSVMRRGFLIGDGTGVGKGREIVGIIIDNYRQGRKKAVWFSENNRLLKDAMRDTADLKYPAKVHQLGGSYSPLLMKDGLLFTSYGMLKGSEKKGVVPGVEPKKRIDQIIDWLGKDFDGVIVFDEAHNMAKAMVDEKAARKQNDVSQTALAGLALQDALPNARIVYVSATSATEVRNLAYAKRLGLWGEKTPFANAKDFVSRIVTAGVAAMEMVARDMKALGMYLARSLSYKGINYSKITHDLNENEVEVYNKVADAWQMVFANLDAVLEETNQKQSAAAKRNAVTLFWGTQQRFFNQLITAMQMPSVIDAARKDLEAGHAVVMQLVNTNEASQERMAAKQESEAEEGEDVDLEFGPMDTLIDYVAKAFPILQYEEVEDEDGNVKVVPVKDSNGDPVESKVAKEIRDAVISELKGIAQSSAIPGNPLDIVIEEFGAANVAEATGRGRRFIRVRGKDGEYKQEEHRRGSAAVQADIAAFQADKKRVLLFSGAAGTGVSFHADKSLGADGKPRTKNQRLRRHYLVQPGWRADKAMQGFGRTHRTDQKQPPEYILVTTNLKGQKRFVSSIARRLDQLGALTKGERKTATTGMFDAADNLESQYATDALNIFFTDLNAGTIDGLNLAVVAPLMGLQLKDPKTGAFSQSRIPTMTRFMNRLLALRVDLQNQMFDEFFSRMEEIVAKAKEDGSYDEGLETLRAISTEKEDDQVIYEDDRTKAVSRYVKLALTKALSVNEWEEIHSRALGVKGAFMGFFRDNQTNQVFAVIDRGKRIVKNMVVRKGQRYNPTGGPKFVENLDSIESGGDWRYVQREGPMIVLGGPGYRMDEINISGVSGSALHSFAKTFNQGGEDAMRVRIREYYGYNAADAEIGDKVAEALMGLVTTGMREQRINRYEKIGMADSVAAEEAWREAVEKAPKTEVETVHMVTGIILPIWDRFSADEKTRVARVQTTDGERLLGRVLREDSLQATLKRLNVSAAKISVGRARELIMAGRVANLANGWVMKKSRVSGEDRIEITKPYGTFTPGDMAVLKQQGAFIERINYSERVFVPTSEDEIVNVDPLTRILESHPIVEMSGGLYKRRGAAGAVEQTDTPAFKKWFKKGVVVNPDGSPKRMYHGTQKGFSVFRPNRSSGDRFHFGTQAQANERAGVWGTTDAVNEGVASQVLPVYLNLQNPLRVPDLGDFTEPLDWVHRIDEMPDGEFPEELKRDLFALADEEAAKIPEPGENMDFLSQAIPLIEAYGYDGLVYLNRGESINREAPQIVAARTDEDFRALGGEDSYMAFHPEQIKSAVGNSGEFNEADPDMMRSRPAVEPGVGMPKAEIDALLAEPIRRLRGVADIEVLQSVADLSDQALPSDVMGVWYDGNKIRLIADNIRNAEEAQRIFVHEVFGHMAAERHPWFNDAIQSVIRMRRVGSREITALWKEVLRTHGRLDDTTMAKEVIALMAERGTDAPILQKLMAAVRAFIRGLGITLEFNDDDIRHLIRSAATDLEAEATKRDLLKWHPDAERKLHSTHADWLNAALAELYPGPLIDMQVQLERELNAAERAGKGRLAGALKQILHRTPLETEDELFDQLASAASLDAVAEIERKLGLIPPGSKLAALSRSLRAGTAGMRVENEIAEFSRPAMAITDIDSGQSLEELQPIEAAGMRATRRLGRAQPTLRERQQAVNAVNDPLYARRGPPLSADLEAIYQSTMAEPADMLGARDRARGFVQRLKNIDWLTMKQGIIDSYASIEALERGTFGAVLDAAQSAWKAALATRNHASVMAAVFVKGVPDYIDGVLQPVAGRKGFIEIFDRISQHPAGNVIKQWKLWAAANRANRLIGEDRERNFTQAQIDEALRLADEYSVDGVNVFQQTLDEWQQMNREALDLAEKLGVVDGRTRALWEKNDYVPFFRVMEDVETGPGGTGTLANQRSPIKKLHGGVAPLGDIVENMVMNLSTLIDRSHKNVAMERIVGLATGIGMEKVNLPWQAQNYKAEDIARAFEKAGIDFADLSEDERNEYVTLFHRIAPRGKDIVSVMRNGRPVYYRVTDPLLLQSIASLGPDVSDGIMQLFGGAKRLLTGAVTADPAFMLANFVRDTLSNWVTSGASFHPFTGPMKGIKASLAGDDVLFKLMMAGGGGGGYYESQPDEVRKLLAEKMPEGQIGGFMKTIVSPKRAWRVWKKIGGASENANRLAVFNSVVDNGGSVAEAAFQARDVLNFSMRGDFKAMRYLVATVPFMNARVQGLYRLWRGARDNPKAFAIRGMFLMAATFALMLANEDDKDYEELPEWDKDTYWHIFAGGEHYRIPKPFEVGIMFSTLPERLWRAASGRDSSGILFTQMGKMLSDTLAFNPVPQLVKPMLEQYANRNSFTGSPIVGMSERGLVPEAQYNPWTSDTARLMAEALPDWAPEWLRSPIRLQAGLRGYFGTMGQYALGVADPMARKAGGFPEPAAETFYDLPVIRRFMRDPNPKTTKYANELYNMLDEANDIHRTIKVYRERGEAGKAREMMLENRGKLAVRGRLNALSLQVRAINNQMNMVQFSKLSAEDKRDRMALLQARKNEITSRVAGFAEYF